MEMEITGKLRGQKLLLWKQLLAQQGLEPENEPEQTVLIWEDDQLIATGSRQGNLLKYIAVDSLHQGQDLTAKVLTQLRQEAFCQGHRHLFLYTKPKNRFMFSSLFFYPVAQTEAVLLMEDRQNGIRNFLDTLPVPTTQGRIGAAVMNCNPFTLGHRYLIETAAAECDHVYVFVLSEDRSEFPAADRLELVKEGTKDLSNVTVLPTGPYLISAATFPTYFLKDRDQASAVQCMLDIEIFIRYYVPKFSICARYVGTEPLSAMTELYNRALEENLPGKGVQVRLVPRRENPEGPISATRVRSLLHTGDREALSRLVPPSTLDYLIRNHLI